MKNFNEIQKIVGELLNDNPPYRDNDNLLVCRVWRDVIKGKYKFYVSTTAFLGLYEDGKLPTADTITRSRRKLQELYPHLRGDAYHIRKGIKQIESKAQLLGGR